MSKQAYLQKKRRQTSSIRWREKCPDCLRPLSVCLCPCIRPFETRTRFVILMHPKEARKTKNGTGRLAHLALQNSEIVTGVDFSESSRIKALLEDEKFHPMILYPGKTSLDISACRKEQFFGNGKKLLIFVVDGTWTAARKMMKMSGSLHQLPRIAVRADTPSRFVIKRQPHRLCLATAESIFVFLKEMERLGIENLNGSHKTLMVILEKLVKIQMSYIENADISGYRRKRNGLSLPERTTEKSHKLFPFFR